MKSRSRKARAIQESINRVLIEFWDPIGIKDGGPADEYWSYVGGIYHLLAGGASEDQIIERLDRLETVSMGLSGNRQRLKTVAEKLLQLNIS